MYKNPDLVTKKEITSNMERRFGGELYDRYWSEYKPFFGPEITSEIERRLAVGEITVLDVGSGAAEALHDLKQRYPAIHPVGIDLFASQQREGVSQIRGDAEQLPLGDSTVDLIISVKVFMYLQDKLKFISEAYRVLKSSGVAYIDMHTDPSGYTEPGLAEIIDREQLGDLLSIHEVVEDDGFTTYCLEIDKIDGRVFDWEEKFTGASQYIHKAWTRGTIETFMSHYQ